MHILLLFGGFVKEGASFGTYKRFYNTEVSVLELPVTEEQYSNVRKTIEYVKEHKEEYKFNILGMFLAGFNKKRKLEKTYYCAEFVRTVLEKSNIDISGIPEVVRPENFKKLKNTRIIYKGLLKEYNNFTNKYMENILELVSREKDLV